MKYRIEHDSIGSKEVPVDAYYGVQSLRGQENFQITSQFMRPEFIWSLAAIKKAAAIVNREVGILRFDIAGAIIKACDDIGVRYALIEQDNAVETDSLACMKASHDYLVSVGGTF